MDLRSSALRRRKHKKESRALTSSFLLSPLFPLRKGEKWRTRTPPLSLGVSVAELVPLSQHKDSDSPLFLFFPVSNPISFHQATQVRVDSGIPSDRPNHLFEGRCRMRGCERRARSIDDEKETSLLFPRLHKRKPTLPSLGMGGRVHFLVFDAPRLQVLFLTSPSEVLPAQTLSSHR
ncbi:hypothetical protein IE53DRAFT_77911 [Violaceomyces palustris]|uniref:Uncharacterized protein n=1 Tax=Violaceomyces palustris TaxID=1673888 RepID=A0ACD0NY90_9BASI|nr:hypothetical protein IE53DRAFT_77911 [Violaceomyces palustris]